jgi:integrase
MTTTFNFTKESLAGLPLPKLGQRAVYLDAKMTGLQIRVTHSGIKTFSLYRRVKGGQPERVTLGRFPDMTVEQARKLASRVNAEIEEGSNPAEVRRAHKGMPTFAEFFMEYGERHGKRKRTWRDDQQRYRDYLDKPLGVRKLDAVTREMVGRILSNMEREGKAGATVNNVRALVSGIFSKAIEWSYVSVNPVQGIKTRKTNKRDRFLQADELPRFFAAVAEEPNDTIRDYFLVALFTGARRANVLAMRWAEVNLAEGLWRIPRTKNGDPQNVTLSPEAVTILQMRKEAAEEGAEFVFPGTGASGHLVEPKKGWARVLERADITDLRIHDLRRTLGSWQAKTGASLTIIGKSLNHKNMATTAIYARLDLDPVRQSVNTATAAMLEAAGLKPVAQITKIKR